MSGAVELAELTSAQFQEQCRRLRLVARSVPARGRFAEQRSRQQGAGIEFVDHRGYVPGDELRKVDWNLYRRLGKLFVRRFEEREDLPVYLLPDVSRSAFHGEPPRARAGIFAAAALASVALGQHDRVALMPFADELGIDLPPTSGSGKLVQVLQHLSRLEGTGGTDLAAGLRRFEALGLRRGLCVVISDLFDPSGLEAVTAALATITHRLLIVQLVRASDRDPGLSGDLRLVDCEASGVADVSVDEGLLTRYRAAYDRFREGLLEFANRRQVGLVPIDADQPVVPQLERLFRDGRLEV